MIELVFGESAAASLKEAKAFKKGAIPGAIATVGGRRGRKDKEPPKPPRWIGVALDGNPKDVEALPLALDYGDISRSIPGLTGRQEVLEELYFHPAGVSKSIWETAKHALSRLEKAKITGEPVRAWISRQSPEEMCGLHFLCSLMHGSSLPLSVVWIPDEVSLKDGELTTFRSTNEIDPKHFGAFAEAFEEPLSDVQRRAYNAAWVEMCSENAPLRAVVNGRLRSVPETFYDFILLENMPHEDTRAAMLIGKTLSALNGVSDSVLFRRILDLLRTGVLEEVSPATPDHPYSSVIRRT